MSNSVKDLSPDGYSRFSIMTEFIKALRTGKSSSFTLLDVGGSSKFMSESLKAAAIDARLTALDILPKPDHFVGEYVIGDATAMKFEEGAFDIVVSTDVLEHILPDKKNAFVEECMRVAKDAVIIAAPFDSDGVDDGERSTNALNKHLFGKGQKWLDEHFLFGKPDLEKTKALVESKGYDYRVVGTNNLYTWIMSTQINLIEAKLGLNNRKHLLANRVYNRAINFGNEFVGPSYRHFFIIFKKNPGAATIKKIEAIAQKSNTKAAVTYEGDILKLLTNSLIEARKHEANLQRKVYQLQELEEANRALGETIERQAKIIRYCTPYLKLLKTPPAKAILKMIRSRSINQVRK